MIAAQVLDQAVKLHQAGNLHAAEQLYRRILETEPRHGDALHLLGVLAHQVGRNDLAIGYIRQALQEMPLSAAAHGNLGVALQALGQLEESVAYLQRAIQLKPDFAEAYSNLGNALRLQNKPEEAVPSLQQAVRLAPASVGALINLGLALQKLNRLDEAVAYHQHAVRLMPGNQEAHNHLGLALQNQGKLDQAASNLEQALHLKPDYAEAHLNLGSTRKRQGRLAEAVACFERAMQLKPDMPEAHNDLGSARLDQGRFADAAICFEQAIRLKPDYAEAFNNLGNAQYQQGKVPEAAASYDRALLLDPENPYYHFHRAVLWLIQGDFARGWAEYEWRWRRATHPPRPFSQPLWQGEPLAGRTILLHPEQGIGDTLHMVRYVQRVAAQGAGRVLLECPAPLVRLLNSSSDPSLPDSLGADQVVPEGQPLPPFDVHAPLMSLPLMLGTTSIERIPSDIPYLYCDPDLVRHWRTRIESLVDAAASTPKLRVGIAWQGSPVHLSDRVRSVPLARLAPLGELPGVRLISLQRGSGSEQLGGQPDIADLGQELSDFADTAAVLQSLDLVVTVDTALAHLAGALGIETWVALPFALDWRWLLERTDSPWYPSLRLFRQSRPGEWDEVFERILAAMSERVSGRSG